MLRYLAPLVVTFVGLQRLGLLMWAAFKVRKQEEVDPAELRFSLEGGLLESAAILSLGVYLFLLASQEDYHSLVLVYMGLMFALIGTSWRLGHWLSVRFKPRVDTALVEAAKAATEVVQTLARRSNVYPELKEGSDIHEVLNKLGRALAKHK